MKMGKIKRTSPDVKFPSLIKDKSNFNNPNPILAGNRNLKLQKISKQKNVALIDIAKIDKIQKQFSILTKRHDNEQIKKQKDSSAFKQNPAKDQMRESRLLLLKNITPQPIRKQNANLLSSLVQYNTKPNNKKVNIPASNISISPTKQKKLAVNVKKLSDNFFTSQYQNSEIIQKVDFVKLFIIQQLLFYISKLKEKVKEQMTGFCRFYNENNEEQTIEIISQVLIRKQDYLQAIFYEKIGFYIFLILGTDIQLEQEASFLLNSLTQYIHKNNLIILDMLIEIVDVEKYSISSQFHVYNTSRFNEDRRKIKHNQDRMALVAKNNKSLVELIRSILTNCGFDSLKSFVFEILANDDVEIMDKIKEVSMMLVSLDAILINSIHQPVERPQPPFLTNLEGDKKYTLVLDMDETLIHYKQIEGKQPHNSFLIRPYCQQFLSQLFKYYEIVIFTAAVKQYADSILDSIDEKKRISYRLYRQHTRLEDFVSIKDLSLINRDLSKTIIVDNIASNFKLQPRNGIAISTWTGEQDDVALNNLIPVLKKLAVQKVNDVRDGLEKLSEYMEMQMSKNQQINFDSINLVGL